MKENLFSLVASYWPDDNLILTYNELENIEMEKWEKEYRASDEQGAHSDTAIRSSNITTWLEWRICCTEGIRIIVGYKTNAILCHPFYRFWIICPRTIEINIAYKWTGCPVDL